MDLKGQQACLACTKRAQFDSQDHSKQLWLYSEPRIPRSWGGGSRKMYWSFENYGSCSARTRTLYPGGFCRSPVAGSHPLCTLFFGVTIETAPLMLLDVSAIVLGPNWWEMTAEAARSGLCPLWNVTASRGGRDSQGLTICDLAPDTERGEGKKRDSPFGPLVPGQCSYQQKID